MDFYSQQEKARQYTKLLLLYFLIAIICIVVAVNVIVYYFFIFLESYPYTPQDWFSGTLVYYISIGTTGLIVLGSLYRWNKLKGGGHAVAVMVGAKPLDLHTSDYKQRQFINVVEEMSIASGVTLPALYILEDEPGINAFVAGYLPTEAVMVVTQGAVENLTREELQGVVAHEYSHILNGDMQINIKLVAVLAGILLISAAGRVLMRGSYRSSRGKSSIAIVILGGLLLLVGYIGVFFGRLIKAAVSRQREYLADAASVQFTRNPQGLAAALNKIREAAYGSSINNVHAEEMSHMCFSQALKAQFTERLATHPPLVDRIKRIDPTYLSRVKARNLTEKNMQARQPAEGGSGLSEMLSAAAPMTARDFVETAGQIDQAHISYAVNIHQSFSEELMDAVHQTSSAKLMMLNMVLAKMDINAGMMFLRKKLQSKELEDIALCQDEIFKLEDRQRLPLFDLLLPSLKLMNDNDKVEFIDLFRQLIKSDKRYTLFEFVLLSLLEQHMSAVAGENIKTRFFSFKPIVNELQLVFSMVAQSGGGTGDSRIKAYQQVIVNFPMKSLGLLAMKELTPTSISQALQNLSQLSPLLKRSVIEACADIAMHDSALKASEAELLRVISERLNCPLPPLLPQAVS